MERRIEKRQLANIITLFLIVQFGGLLFAYYTVPPYVISQIVAPATASASQSVSYLLYLVVVIVIASVALILLSRAYKGSLLFTLLEAYAIGMPTFFIVAIFLIPTIFPNVTIIEALVLGFVAAAALILAKNKWPTLRNFATVVASIGIGVVIGVFFGFTFAYLFLAVIAVYDYIAVFVTKHMQVMAKAMAERNLAFLIGSSDVEMTPGSFLSSKEKTEIKSSIKKNKIKDPTIKRMVKEGAYPSVSQVALGGGDLALPLMLAVGAYISFSSIFIPVMIILGAGAGLIATMSLLEKYKVPLPAIPPLFAFMNIALSLALFVAGKVNVLTSLAFLALALVTLEILLVTLRRNQQRGKQLAKA
jgi:presenilin-like A22 family membrane protease